MTISEVRLDKLLSSLGYCSRKEARELVKAGRVSHDGRPARSWEEKVRHDSVTLDGEPLDAPFGTLLLLHKPVGFVCSRKEVGSGDPIVYELLPPRFQHRNPPFVSVGRLDKDSSGLLLFTDDGQLVHRLTSPKKSVPKHYEVTVAHPLRGDEGELFASGSLRISSAEAPLLPAALEVVTPTMVRLIITEGRHRQIRRMFEVIGNEVVTLHRYQIGKLKLGALPSGEYRLLSAEEKDDAAGVE